MEIDNTIKEITSSEEAQLVEKVISINRIAKTTKGGKKLSFSALVVVGDKNGHVGIGMLKASEVSKAILKAVAYAKKHLEYIPLKGGTILFPISAKSCASIVLIKPAPPGTGIVAGNTTRAILEAVGVRDAVCKSLKSNNPINVLKATMLALKKTKMIYNLNQIRKETGEKYNQAKELSEKLSP